MNKKHTIITHAWPHLDEILAIYFFKTCGVNLPVKFWENRNETPDGRSTEEWEKEGNILLGLAGSSLDEHSVGEKKRKEGCVATLVAEQLEISDKPELKKLLAYTEDNDLNGGSHPFSLPYLIVLRNQQERPEEKTQDWAEIACKAFIAKEKKIIDDGIDLNDQNTLKAFKKENREAAKALWKKVFERWLAINVPKNKGLKNLKDLEILLKFSRSVENGTIPEFSLPALALAIARNQNKRLAEDWLFAGIETKYQEQKAFWDSVKEFNEKANFFKKDGKKIVVLESDNPVLAKIARSKIGGYCAITIIKRNNGNVAILTNQRQRIGLVKVVAALRLLEQKLTKADSVETDPRILEAESFLGIWHYLINGEMVFNGSLTTTVESSKIPLNQIRDIVLNNFIVK